MLGKSVSARREKRNLATGLTRDQRKLELVPNPLKDVALGNAAGVAFIDGGAQRGKLGLVAPFLAFQDAQRRTDHFTGVLITPALDLGQHETVELVGQIDVAGGHDGGPPCWRFHNLPSLANIAKNLEKTATRHPNRLSRGGAML